MNILLNLLCTPLNSFNPFLIIFLDIPIVIATATAAVAFLILCIPSKGILILFTKMFFFPGNLIERSNSENSFNCFIFLIQNCDFKFNPYV